MPGTSSLAECREASVHYGSGEARVDALREVSLEIGEAERMALWGPSGSGKTTVLHLLGGLVTPSAGSVEWRGRPLSALDAAARARARAQGIGYVFQGANLLAHFTAHENVAFAARAARRQGGIDGDGSGPVARAGTGGGSGSGSGSGSESGSGDPTRLLTLVGLHAKLDALPAELSGGEAQRVAIARALAQQPALLLCDEPTGHLDSNTGERTLDLVDALQRELGFALVVATHDPDVAARYDRTVELADGRVVSRAVPA